MSSVHHKQRLQDLSLHVLTMAISSSNFIRNLGIAFDPHLMMSQHVTKKKKKKKKKTFSNKLLFCKMYTRVTNMNFTITSPKTSVAPLAIIADSKTHLSQSDALQEKWKSPGGLGDPKFTKLR